MNGEKTLIAMTTVFMVLSCLANNEWQMTCPAFSFKCGERTVAGRDYNAEILSDDLSDSTVPRGYRHEKRIVRRGDKLKVKMSAAGGYCAVVRN